MSFDAYTTAGQGQNLFQQLPIQSIRDPVNGVDFNDPTGGPYQIGRRWFNKTNENYWHYVGQGIWVLDASLTGPILQIGGLAGTSPIMPDATGDVNFSSTGGTITITGSAGGLNNQNINFDVAGNVLDKVAVDLSSPPGTNPVIPTGNQITIEGGTTFPTGTSSKPIRTDSLAASTIDLEIQLAGSNPAVLTANNYGVAQFDSNQFAVATGFVQLKGGGTAPALTKLGTQTGTNPVVPDSTGKITFNGATVAAGVNPVRTDGTGANTVALEVQTAQAIAATDATKIGLSNFYNNQFAVDANGFVTLAGGGTAPALTKVAVQTGTSPIVPNASGQLTFNGATVAAGTNPVRTDGTGANTMALEVQISQAIGATDATKIGLAAFNSAQFTVDANGFVSSTSGSAVSSGTYSPTIIGATTAGVGTYTRQNGNWMKVGPICFVLIDIAWTAHTGTGDQQVTLPFNCAASPLYCQNDGDNPNFADGTHHICTFATIQSTNLVRAFVDASATPIAIQNANRGYVVQLAYIFT